MKVHIKHMITIYKASLRPLQVSRAFIPFFGAGAGGEESYPPFSELVASSVHHEWSATVPAGSPAAE